MMFDIEKIKQIFRKHKYYPTEELLWRTYINLEKSLNVDNVGQNIYAICLEGPPGSGKSEYAKVYAKMLSEILNEKVEVISKNFNERQETETSFLRYTCNASTGKEALIEDIRISSAIIGRNDDVIISGILINAIIEANKGKKVVLFLDEYDKAKSETDGFLLEFLQDGRIFSTQSGEIIIKNPRNLQVIICKNDSRVELSGALTRRLNEIRLDHMIPELMIQVINDKMNDYDSNIKTLVILLYNLLYKAKDEFKKLPSCPEVMMAIQEAEILKKAKAPTKFIYNCIITNMIKSELDLYSFEKIMGKSQNLNRQILAFKEIFNRNIEDFSDKIYQTIYDLFFKGKVKEYDEKDLNPPTAKEVVSSQSDENEVGCKKINIDTSNDFICGNIEIGKSRSKLDLSEKWYKVGTIDLPLHRQNELINKAQEIMYDGPVFYHDDNYSLIAIKIANEDVTNATIEFYASHMIMPTMAVIKLKEITSLLNKNLRFNFEFLTPTQFKNVQKNENNLVYVNENNKNISHTELFNSVGEIKIYSLKDKTILFNAKDFMIQNFGRGDMAVIGNNRIKIPLEQNYTSIIQEISCICDLPFETTAIASNRTYSVLTLTNEQFIRTINYQTKSWNINLESIDLNAMFKSSVKENDNIAMQLNNNFSSTSEKQKILESSKK